MDWLKLLGQYGPFAAVAVFLLAQSAGIIPSLAADTKLSFEQHKIEVHDHHETQTRAFDRLVEIGKQSQAILRATCLNAAKDRIAQQTCVQTP